MADGPQPLRHLSSSWRSRRRPAAHNAGQWTDGAKLPARRALEALLALHALAGDRVHTTIVAPGPRFVNLAMPGEAADRPVRGS